MKTNLKAVLSAAAVAALLASPAMARSHHVRTHEGFVNVPYDARAAVRTYAAPPAVTVYGADLPSLPHRNGNLAPDFQLNRE